MTMTDIRPLELTARRLRTLADREQTRGLTDGSIRQTRRMYLSITASQRATAALARAIADNNRQAARGLCG